MILVCGIPSEPPIAAAIESLEKLGHNYVVFNQRDFATSDLRWNVAKGKIEGEFVINGDGHALSSFDGFYVRLMDDRMLPELEHEPPDSPAVASSRRFHESLIHWVDLAPGRVVNRFRHMGSNGSKPYQQQLIMRAGFSIPTTLVTNDPDAVRAFAAQHKRIIYKSVSGVRSIVAEMDGDGWDRLDAIRSCPVQFQAYVPGYDVRVHTVGSDIFATRIDSPGTDYRYTGHGDGGTRLEPYDLPADISSRCVQLAADLELAFAGIDLRFTPDGNVVCFEVNPSPAYSYYQAHTGQEISLSLANYLAGTFA